MIVVTSTTQQTETHLDAADALKEEARQRARRQFNHDKGQHYPADPPTVDEIVAVMRQASHDRHGHRVTALIVVLWRAGLRIHEALSLTETGLGQRRGSILVKHGKNDRRREVGMDAWAWSAIEP
jgi:site-specific recombinase XerD